MTIQAAGATAKDSGVPTKDYGLAEYMYSRLPDVHRLADLAQGITVDAAKRQRPSIDDSQVPAENRGETQLMRFLRILAGPFNFARTQTDVTLFLVDAERTEAKWLNSVAKIVGWDLNNELPVEIQRKEILAAVDLYKRKGRETAIGFLIDQLTDFDYELVEMKDRLLRYWTDNTDLLPNGQTHTFDPVDQPVMGEPNDTNFYTLGTNSETGYPYSPTGIVLFLYQNLLNQDYLLLTAKIQRVLQDFAPFGVTITMITIGVYTEPSYDAINTIIESNLVHHEDRLADVRFGLRYWDTVDVLGYENPGGLFDTQDAGNYYLTWDFWMQEVGWTHRIIP